MLKTSDASEISRNVTQMQLQLTLFVDVCVKSDKENVEKSSLKNNNKTQIYRTRQIKKNLSASVNFLSVVEVSR